METTRLSTKGQIVLPKGLRVSRDCARPSIDPLLTNDVRLQNLLHRL